MKTINGIYSVCNPKEYSEFTGISREGKICRSREVVRDIKRAKNYVIQIKNGAVNIISRSDLAVLNHNKKLMKKDK